MKKVKSQNKKKKKTYNWEYHEKLSQKYESYLYENMDKNNLRLKGNYHYENKPLKFYLSQKEVEPINNSNLTPLPLSKYLNNKTKDKNLEDYKKYSNIQKSVVEMRRIEYNANIKKRKKSSISEKEAESGEKDKKKIKEKKEEKKEKIEMIENKGNKDNKDYKANKEIQEIQEKKIINNKFINKNMRKSCIQFPSSIKLSTKKRKIIDKKEIIRFIIKNIGKIPEEEIPKEVKNYLKKLIPALIKIQKRFRLHLKNLIKIIKIQVNFRAHYYSNLYKEYSLRKYNISKFIYIIQKVFFLNLYHLKVSPNKIYSSKKSFITKNIYRNNYILKLSFLQKEIKAYLHNKNLKRVYGKKKCVYKKPLTINPLGKIRLLQRNIILFLERLKRRHIIVKSQLFSKKNVHTQKIILIQRFAKSIHQDIINPLITKDSFNKNNIFVKSNRKFAHKKTLFIDTKIIPFKPKKINKRVKNKDSKITKLHKYLGKIIFLQKNIKIYFSRVDYDIYDYPKCEEYITKDSFVLPNKENILLLQREIKYFLYRQNIKRKTIKKVVIHPLKITKNIRTNTEKIFMRLSKLRIMYDKNLIFFIVKFIEVIKKYLGRISFNLINEASKRKKLFSVKGGNYKNAFRNSNLLKNAIIKVVEPEYKFTPLKPPNKKFLSDKNNAIYSFLNLGSKKNLDIEEKSKTKRGQNEEELPNNKKIEEIKDDHIEDEK